MGANTKIEWADHTFNPWIGCTRVSPACDYCYAERYGKRIGVDWGAGVPRRRTNSANWKQPLRWDRRAQIEQQAWEQFKATQPGLTDERLLEQGFIKPSRPRVFCGSLCDVFDNEVNRLWRTDLLYLISRTPHLDWLLLTKRIGNAEKMLRDANCFDAPPFPWRHVWIGATVCNQEEADRDIPKLLALPAAKRFLSIEPMLGPIDLRMVSAKVFDPILQCNLTRFKDTLCGFDGYKIDWVICGGESGPHARPTHPAWVRGLRDQCQEAGVAFFFKQWGEFAPPMPKIWPHSVTLEYHEPTCTVGADHYEMVRVGKKAAGRLLDGCEWNEVPQ